MMKKTMHLFAATAIVASLASCSNEEVFNSVEGDGNMTFTVSLPGGDYGSRAFADGLSADKLAYAVYDASTDALVTQSTKDFGNSLTTNVTLTLVNGKSYKIAFFAYNVADDVYTFDAEAKTVSVAYDNMAAYNSSDYDAFFKLEEIATVTGPLQRTVTLTRPLAQVNWGTRDLGEGAVIAEYGADAANLTSAVTFKGVYTGFNMLDGSMVGAETDVTFEAATRPDATEESFPVQPTVYQYVSMNYILVPAEQSLVEAELTPYNGTTAAQAVKVTNLPVQANYRTNIYGALLTNPLDVEIVKDKEFETPDNDLEIIWDGKTITYPVIDDEAKTGTVLKASDLQGLAELTSGEDAKDFEGYTFSLHNDIDFGGHQTKPIADGAGRSGSVAKGSVFKGTIDGNGHTVKNLAISNNTSDVYTGFIANLSGSDAALVNLNFENISIEAPNCEAAAVVSMVSEGATVKNVHVLSGSISGKQGVGGIVGRVLKNGHLENCSNHADISATTNNAGGIAGTAYYTENNVVMTISDCHNYGDVHADNVSAGGIAGLSNADITDCTNEGNISANNNSCGGIVGAQNARGVISGCVNKGNIVADATSNGFGGIVGWIRYESNTMNYPNQSVIEVVNCENQGSIDITSDDTYGASGIVGLTYRNAKIDKCVNKARKISAKGMVAGITVFQNTGYACPVANPMLTVTNCTSTTNVDTQMTGALKADLVYDNTAGEFVTLKDNTYSPAE